MHVHTSKYSSCSILDPIRLIHRASELGLSGIAIVEHYNVWSHEEIEKLKREPQSGLLILRGQEVTCSIGHLLIFGYYDRLEENLVAGEILNKVHEKRGIVIMAHPFRNGNGFGESLAKLKNRFAYVDGIEVFNANHNRAENEYGRMVWEALGIAGIGGSDAHSVGMVGRYLTWFQNVIRNEDDLITEIENRRCKPIEYVTRTRLW